LRPRSNQAFLSFVITDILFTLYIVCSVDDITVRTARVLDHRLFIRQA